MSSNFTAAAGGDSRFTTLAAKHPSAALSVRLQKQIVCQMISPK